MGNKRNLFQLSEANLTDIDALLNIENSCFETDRLTRRQIRYLLSRAKAFTLLIKVKGLIVAYCIFLTPILSRSARLYSLAVLANYRNKGFAGELLCNGIQKLSELGYQSCNLEVRSSDKKTQNFYKKYGFNPIKTLSSYYEDGEDGLKMKSVISESYFRDKK